MFQYSIYLVFKILADSDSQDVKDARSSLDDVSSIHTKTSKSGKSPRRRNKYSASSWVSNKLNRTSKGNDLSAAFNLFDYDHKANLVNINAATEEELMTLSGVTR